MLNTEAVLVTRRKLVVVYAEPSYIRGVNRLGCRRTAGKRNTRVRHLHVVEGDAQAERNIGAGVVHFVALDALVHYASAAADPSLPATGEVVCKANSWTTGGPGIVDQTFGNAALARAANTVQ